MQGNEILHDKAKVIAKKEFFQRIRIILKNEINTNNTIDAIRTYAMLVMRYRFGILKWTVAELRTIDRKVRKILTKGKIHHPKSNTHRLYMSRKEGARGLIGAFDCHGQECTALATYLENSEDDFSKIILENERQKSMESCPTLTNYKWATHTQLMLNTTQI